MNLSCSKLEKIAHSLPLVRACDVVRNGALRMSTPFLYPNGERVDVFLEEKPGSLFYPLSLSDYGHTALYLRDALGQMDHGERKQDIFESILGQLGVRYVDGDLFIDIEEKDSINLRDPIFRLSQACVRLADFAAHAQIKRTNPFRDQLADFLKAGVGWQVAPDVRVRGQYQNEIRIDFQVFGQQQSSYLCALAPSEGATHTSANEVFRKFHDIRAESVDIGRIAVYSSKSKLKEPDKKRLGEYSTVLAYPSEQKRLIELIAA